MKVFLNSQNIAFLKGNRTINDITQVYPINPNQTTAYLSINVSVTECSQNSTVPSYEQITKKYNHLT